VAFTYLKVKSTKCLCSLPVVLVLLFWSWSQEFGLIYITGKKLNPYTYVLYLLASRTSANSFHNIVGPFLEFNTVQFIMRTLFYHPTVLMKHDHRYPACYAILQHYEHIPATSNVQNTLKKYFEITKIKYSYKVF